MNGSSPLLQRLFSLEGKAALITGATGGIGSVLAVAYAEAGAIVGVHGRDQDKTERLCAEVEAIGGRAVPLVADLCDVAACKDLVAKANAEMGRLDILINNAATNRRKRIKDVTPEDFDEITAVNLRGVY